MMKMILTLALLLTLTAPTANAQRVTDQLTALYDFNETSGDRITGIGPDLLIQSTVNTTWTTGGLLITAPTQIESTIPASDITTASMASNELTLEAWVRNTTLDASGPARIISLGASGSLGGNFMMGQDGTGIEVRCLTTTTDQYGKPALLAANLLQDNDLHHLVYTRNTIGETALYVNTILVASSYALGQLSTWGDHTLTLASESLDSGQRSWLGELRLIAIYSKALSTNEINQNFLHGESGDLPPELPPYNPLVDAKVIWNAPVDGTPVDRYLVQHSIDGNEWYAYAITDGSRSVHIQINFFNNHRVRIAGIDADGRQGLFSLPSDVYNASTIYPHPADKPTREIGN